MLDFILHLLEPHPPIVLAVVAVFYAIGMGVFIYIKKFESVKGWTGLDNDKWDYVEQDLSPLMVWNSLIWILYCCVFVIKLVIYLINFMGIPFVCMFVGFKYKETRMYNFIEEQTNVDSINR